MMLSEGFFCCLLAVCVRFYVIKPGAQPLRVQVHAVTGVEVFRQEPVRSGEIKSGVEIFHIVGHRRFGNPAVHAVDHIDVDVLVFIALGNRCEGREYDLRVR